jgi:hypothetical protein
MSEGCDYTPASWSAGDTFASARAAYDVHVGRSYDDAVDKGLTASDLLPDSITTDVEAPVVILTDETGSMGSWPATIFSKLGYLDHELESYMGPSTALAFGAFGDATCNERYPVQMRPFGRGQDLQKYLLELVIEGGGGGQQTESAELAMLYVDRNVHAPNATKPVLILITDEMAYSDISAEMAKRWSKASLAKSLSIKEMIESLKSKWSVYVVRKPYQNTNIDSEDFTNRTIREFWEKLVGADHIALLPDASRVVDVIFGILAAETGKINEFREELTDRQLKDADGVVKVKTALKALHTIHHSVLAGSRQLPAGKSVKKLPAPDNQLSRTHRPDNGSTTRKSKGLLDGK